MPGPTDQPPSNPYGRRAWRALQFERACCRLHVVRLRGSCCKVWVEKRGNDPFGLQVMQYLQLLRPQSVNKEAYAGDVSARPVDACNESNLDRIDAVCKHNRDICEFSHSLEQKRKSSRRAYVVRSYSQSGH
jgi:hypothetical protein